MEKHLRLKENGPDGGSYIISRSKVKRLKKQPLIDLNYLETVSPGNYDFFLEMMKIFKSDSVSSINIMREQILNNDYSAVAKTAHAIKPTGKYIGVSSFTTLAGNLEKVALAGDASETSLLLMELQRIVNRINLEIDDFINRAY